MRRSGMLGVFGLLLIPALIAIAPSVALASCATDFPSDAGCRFAEKWGGYTVGTLPTNPWYWNGNMSTGVGDAITTPGINGDANKLTFTMHPANGTGYDCPGCPGGAGPGTGFIPNGSRYWAEFFVSFSADFQWGCGGGISGTEGGNCSMKTFDTLASGAQQRLLFTLTSYNGDPHNLGHPYWSIYTNYYTGGTYPAVLAESRANVTDVPFLPGHFYRCVLEVLVGQGSTGAYKFWVCPDGGACTKTHDFSGLQTTTQDGWNGNGTGLGGPAAGPTDNSTWNIGSIRMTTTNISPEAPSAAPTAGTPPAAPTAGTPPAAPTSLVVQ